VRILVFALNYAPDETGGAATATGRGRYLAATGHDVTVIAGFPHTPEWQVKPGYRRRLTMREQIDGVSVVRRWHHVPTHQTAFGRSLMEASFALTATPTGLLQQRPDLVLSVTPSVGAALAGSVAARRFGVPHGIFVLDLAGRAAEQSSMTGGRVARWFAEPLERTILRHATRVAIITEGFRGPLQDMSVPHDRIDLLTDWKETEEPSLPSEEIRRRLGLPMDKKLVLHAGNMGYKQGLEHVVDAAVLAATEVPSLVFVMVGDGNQRGRVEARARAHRISNMLFLPLQPRRLFPSLLGAADVLLLHQRARVVEMSLPSKLADYFASGRPVVAAANEASETSREISRAGGGVVVAPERPRELLKGITELLDDPSRAASLGLAGQEYARSRYRREELAEALDGFVARLGDQVQL